MAILGSPICFFQTFICLIVFVLSTELKYPLVSYHQLEEVLCPNFGNKLYSKGLPCALNLESVPYITLPELKVISPNNQSLGIDTAYSNKFLIATN
jgi:hypothetical protein